MTRRLGINMEATRTGTKAQWKKTMKKKKTIKNQQKEQSKKEKEMEQMRHRGGFGEKRVHKKDGVDSTTLYG